MSSAPCQQSRIIGSNSGPIYSLLSAALPTARPSNPARRTALPQTAAAAHFLPRGSITIGIIIITTAIITITVIT